MAGADGLQPRAAAQILAEIESDAAEPVVAYRGIDRWIQATEPVQLPASADRPSLLRDEGTYLITGGYGAIGLEIARYLASAARANLILVGRGGLPARELWQKHMSLHGRDDEVSRKIRAVQALEESGGCVFAARADVASEAQMREVVTEARHRFGRIDGVFHAAGVAGGGVMQLRKADDVMAVMRPKVTGTRVLARVLADDAAGFRVAVLVAQRRQRRGRPGGLLRGQRLSGCLRPFSDGRRRHVHDLGELGHVARCRNGGRRHAAGEPWPPPRSARWRRA